MCGVISNWNPDHIQWHCICIIMFLVWRKYFLKSYTCTLHKGNYKRCTHALHKITFKKIKEFWWVKKSTFFYIKSLLKISNFLFWKVLLQLCEYFYKILIKEKELLFLTKQLINDYLSHILYILINPRGNSCIQFGLWQAWLVFSIHTIQLAFFKGILISHNRTLENTSVKMHSFYYILQKWGTK